MDQFESSYGNGHGRNTNINQFAPLFELDDKEGTKQRTKPKAPIIVLSVDEVGNKTTKKTTRVKTTIKRRQR